MRNFESRSMRVAVIGTANVDKYLKVPLGGSARADETSLQMELGSKIPPTEHIPLMVGGNGINLARGLARLDKHATLYTHLGAKNEVSTAFIRKTVEDEDIELLAEMPEGSSADLSFILLTPVDRIIMPDRQDRPRGFTPQMECDKPAYIVLNSVGGRNAWEKIYKKVTKYGQDNDIPIAISPGSTQLNNKSEVLYEAIAASNILLLNKEEALDLMRGKGITPPTEDPRDVILSLRKLGPKTLSMTDGANGSYMMTEDESIYHLPPISIEPDDIKDSTGAGDAYASGLISALVDGESAAEMMRRGAINAYFVMQEIGAGEGLLTEKEMSEELRRHSDLQPKLL